jgi:hypothetical protein
MKKLLSIAIISILMMVAGSAWAGTGAVAVYTCSQGDSASEEDVDNAAKAWLAAAKKIKGGEGLEVVIMYPLAATMGESDFLFLVKAPSITAWGTFMDHYEGAALAKEDRQFSDVADCPDSALWEWAKID